ncbi:MAG: DUF1476 domain-containing protein [Micavibrio aeruginosavorus]|nr:DUF1476 domain-containing protein [Micavibrio aeruginosavorus]
MTNLNDRKDAFENKYAHDQEMMFKLEARTSKLFGLWAAEQLGLSGADAETYAKEVVGANLEEAGFEDIKRKVRADFDKKGIETSDHMLDSMIHKAQDEAKIQLEAGK